MAVLGLCCCAGFSLVEASRGYSLVAVLRLLIVVASPVVYRLEHASFSSCRVRALGPRLNSYGAQA